VDINIGIFGFLFLLALIVTMLTARRRNDVLHGAYIEDGLSKRIAAIGAL
jgi:hypothetical protein